jgi:serine/threonine protein kinase
MDAGNQVGQYRLLRQIGDGGMGSVWLAEHVMLGRRAAIKVLHPAYSMQPDIVTRFFNEARAATAISDPGIVQIFDFGQHVDGRAYIVMELLEGETLDQRLRRLGRLGIAEALRVVRQVASSLGAAHARGIVHRDLKPENIFLVRDPEVMGGERAKIVDFGIAKLVGDPSVKTQTSAVMGTPTYMSPEQCRGAGLVDLRSDIYAIGCVLFALMTGTPPFVAEGIGDIIAMHLREPPPAPSSRVSGIPPEVDSLVLRCLAKDPGQRFDSSAELAAEIEALLSQSLPSNAQTISAGLSAPHEIVPASATTLSTAAGSASSAAGHRSRPLALVGAGLGVAAIATVTILLVTRLHTGSSNEGSSPGQPGPVADEMTDARTATPPTATYDAPRPPTEAAGLSMQDAGAPTTVAVDTTPTSSPIQPAIPDSPRNAAVKSVAHTASEPPVPATHKKRSIPVREKLLSTSTPVTSTSAPAVPPEPVANVPPPDAQQALPELDKKLIAAGMASVHRPLLKCRGDASRAVMNLHVVVAAEGNVTRAWAEDVHVYAAEDDGDVAAIAQADRVGRCITGVIRATRFAKTRAGGSFRYPLSL